MARDSEGRIAGHHITPGTGWRWQNFGDRLMLVTDGGGADVVMSFGAPGAKKPLGQVMTCAPDGRLVPLTPDSPVGRLLVALPDLIHFAPGFRPAERSPAPACRRDRRARQGGADLMATVMQLWGDAMGQPLPADGQYLQDFDFEAHDGQGEITMTPNIEDAKGFPSFVEAHAFWKRSPECRPVRLDGKPNRPLTATTWQFINRDDAS
jgi:hypothetical protein